MPTERRTPAARALLASALVLLGQTPALAALGPAQGDDGQRSGPAPAAEGAPWSQDRPSGLPRLALPVAGSVVRRFHAPTAYGPGHRGVDLSAARGATVRATADGQVSFAGTVAGDRWVTVDHGGLRTTVGPLDLVAVTHGQRVSSGQPVGTTAGAHGTDAVHLSARVGDRYVDPLTLLLPVRISLVPLDPAPVATSGPTTTTAAAGPSAAGAWRSRLR